MQPSMQLIALAGLDAMSYVGAGGVDRSPIDGDVYNTGSEPAYLNLPFPRPFHNEMAIYYCARTLQTGGCTLQTDFS